MKNMEMSDQNKSTEITNAEVPPSSQHCGNALLDAVLIEEGNRLIAKFMGLKKGDVWQKWNGHADYSRDSDLEYYSSWEWLMDAIEKIESLKFQFKICRKRVELLCDTDVITKPTKLDRYFKGQNKKQSCWIAVVEFIKWYNQYGPKV